MQVWLFLSIRVFFVGALILRALKFGAYIGAPFFGNSHVWTQDRPNWVLQKAVQCPLGPRYILLG